MKKKKRKHSFKERFSYRFDSLMSKGAIAMILLLCLATVIVVLVIGGIAYLALGGGIGNRIWVSLMHALDPGTLAGDGTDSVGFIVLMSLMTLFGLFVTSILIGIITTGFERRLNELKKGRSKVIDEGQTVIIGFNDNLYILLEALIEANSNHKHQCIVVAGTADVELMDSEIRARIDDFKTTHLIVKSGTLDEEYLFDRIGTANARSVIVNLDDDRETVKVLLALNHYLEAHPPLFEEEHIVAVLHEKKYVDGAKIAGGERLDVIYAADAISRIIAHTCSESGLSNVMTEIFDYDGDELYFEEVPECVGKPFSEILNLFPKQVAFGIVDEKGPHLNPPMDTVVREGDRIILMEEDDGEFTVSKETVRVDEGAIEKHPDRNIRKDAGLVVIGTNAELPAILMEYDQFVPGGTVVRVLSQNGQEETLSDLPLQNIRLEESHMDDPDRDVLERSLGADTRNVLLLTNYAEDADTADAETLLNLINISVIEKERGTPFFITSEIRRSANQKLAALIGVDDFIIGSNIVGMIAAQVSENRELLPLFHEILTEEGSEIYMKPASLYVRTDADVNFYTVTEAAARRSEIAIGYKKFNREERKQVIVTNPVKNSKVHFSDGDMIIVIAEDGNA